MTPPDDDDVSPRDRANILQRRATFIARALGSLTVPAVLAACGDPMACLKKSAGAPPPTSSAPAPSASATLSATAAPTGTVAPKEGEFSVTAADAKALGLPPFGFRVTMTKGWSKSGPSKDEYVRASGPPGGPLTFIAKPFDHASEKEAIDALFRKATSDWSGLEPSETGPVETVTLGGRKLEAQAFRTGKSMSTTNWCVIKAPGGAAAPGGIVFLFGTGTNEGIKPTCKRTLDHDWIAEIVSTLAFLE